MIEPNTFRKVMSTWPTGVSIVSGMGPDRRPIGMVIGSFCSVSLSPALVAFFVKTGSTSWREIQEGGGRFCVNVLTQNQADLCRVFAAGDPHKRFDMVPFEIHCGHFPRIDECSAWIDACTEATYEMGDHLMVLGKVTHMSPGDTSSPLVFTKGQLHVAEPLVTQAHSQST